MWVFNTCRNGAEDTVTNRAMPTIRDRCASWEYPVGASKMVLRDYE
jgi:hypothetical protein